jgi:hypothetical protein
MVLFRSLTCHLLSTLTGHPRKGWVHQRGAPSHSASRPMQDFLCLNPPLSQYLSRLRPRERSPRHPGHRDRADQRTSYLINQPHRRTASERLVAETQRSFTRYRPLAVPLLLKSRNFASRRFRFVCSIHLVLGSRRRSGLRTTRPLSPQRYSAPR